MKKAFLLLCLGALLPLGACTMSRAESSSSAAPASSSVDPSSSGSSSSTTSSTSDPSSSSSSSSSLPAWVDYAHDGSVQLELDYVGHTFYVDGIEQVELFQAIDGDTAHFIPKSGKGDNIKARFYGIDTPESTGKVQPYGDEASAFTKGILKEANANGTIVVSSAQDDYGLPNPDSTGSRYVSLVWVNTEMKDAPMDKLYLLNLMIVQEGLSNVKNADAMPQYKETLYKAEQQARDYKLNLFSGVIPDSFPQGDYENVSLLEIKEEVVKSLQDETHQNAFHNKKVRVRGTVAGFANNILYLQGFFPDEDESGEAIVDPVTGEISGQYAGVNIFVGMSAIPSKYTKINTYIQVSGLAKNSDFGFQITDVSMPTVSYDKDRDAQIILKAEENVEYPLYTFQYSVSEFQKVYQDRNYESLYCAMALTEPITVTRAFQAESNSGVYLYFKKGEADFIAYYKFKYQPDPENEALVWDGELIQNLVNRSFMMSGVVATHTTSAGVLQFEILLRSSADLVLLPEE